MKQLQTLTTRHLLGMLANVRFVDDHYAKEDYGYTADEIKAILATREHIPNKKEGEILRRNRQKTKRDARDRKYVR